MAVTPVGNPYVESSDNVADFPGASEALAERIDIVGVNPFADAAARDAAIPSPVQGQMCSLNDDNKGYRYDGSAWVLFSGAGPANFTNTATGTYTDGGIDYKYITFTGSGELVVDQAGFADVLIVGPGAGGGGSNVSSVDGGAGGAGQVYEANVYISAATHTATIGAGGAGGPAGSAPAGHGAPGSITTLGNDLFSIGGGGGGARNGAGGSGASGGGGGGQGAIAGGSAFGPLTGYAGVTSAGGNVGGGGGGSSATGSGATGGAGTSSSLNNSATTYGAGGTAGSLTAGGANTGDGGGSATTIGQAGAAGGSGIIIIRVVV